jgi:hypothetical protein
VEPGGTSVSTHGLGYLFTALRRQGLIADELVLQLTTFLRSLDLFLELMVLTTSTLTANQVRHGGKQGTHNPELSCIHSSPPSIDLTPRETSGLKINYFVNVEIILVAVKHGGRRPRDCEPSLASAGAWRSQGHALAADDRHRSASVRGYSGTA